MTSKYPGIEVFDEPAEWDGIKAQAALDVRLSANPDIKGIYMHAGGVYLDPTLRVLRDHDKLVPPTNPRHVVIVSNDGIPPELDAIRRGDIDATVSQPADDYAEYGLYWAAQALAKRNPDLGPHRPRHHRGQTTQRLRRPDPGSTGHRGQRRRPRPVGNNS